MTKGKGKKGNHSLFIFSIIIIGCSAFLCYNTESIYFVYSLIFGFCLLGFDLFVTSRNRNRYLNSGIRIIDSMNGEEFEECLKEHFIKQGYTTELTQNSRDFGADLIIKKGNIKTAVQAKRYNTTVGIASVQQVYAAAAYYDCKTALVVTNSFFTKPAKELAKKLNVELWDRNTMISTFNIRK